MDSSICPTCYPPGQPSALRRVLRRDGHEHLGLGALIPRHLTECRSGRSRQFRGVDLFRQSIYSPLAGYEDTNDAERLAVDPTFRMLASRERRETCVALTSTLDLLRDGRPRSILTST